MVLTRDPPFSGTRWWHWQRWDPKPTPGDLLRKIESEQFKTHSQKHESDNRNKNLDQNRINDKEDFDGPKQSGISCSEYSADLPVTK